MAKFRRHRDDHDPDHAEHAAGTPESGVSAQVRELAVADVVAFGPVGFAAQTLPATEAYRSIEERLPERVDELRPQLAWLLENGSPAGRVYAATLLNRFDPAAGEAAWRSLAADRSEFSTFTGCVMNRTTLAEYALGHLDHR